MLDALSAQLTRCGGREAHGRKDQASHAILDGEVKQQRVLGTLLPSIFLGVAAFLLNVMVSRLVATQRGRAGMHPWRLLHKCGDATPGRSGGAGRPQRGCECLAPAGNGLFTGPASSSD